MNVHRTDNDPLQTDAVSAETRPTTLHTVALLFLSSALAIFAVLTTVHLPSAYAASYGKVAIIVGFNLFAGMMLADALCQLWRLCRRR